MNCNSSIRNIVLLAALVFFVSCEYRPPSAVSHGGPVQDYVSAVDALRAAGVTVEPGAEVTQPFFSVPGFTATINGERVQFFEYKDPADAAAEARRVSPDGGMVGSHKISWRGPVHFYIKGRIIALYPGNDPKLLATLSQVFAPPFAGTRP